MTRIEAQHVSLTVSGERIVDDISLTLKEGEIVGLIGPNGAGKSTLVRILIGETRPTTGAVHITQKTRIAYVPQSFAPDTYALPISVRECLAIASDSLTPFLPRARIALMKEALHRVGLRDETLTKNMHTLSGGERQRVLLARALMRTPHVLILDEPFSSVDFHARQDMYLLLTQLRDELGFATLIVSHDIGSVVDTCDRILCLNRSLHHGCHPVEFMEHGHTLHAVHHHTS
jgi:zinc transport system ATP-binding protein